MMRFGLPLLVLMLAACTQPPAGPEPRVDADGCGAAEFGSLIGKDRGVLASMKFRQQVRVIGPDMAITADFRADRLNIEYDKNGKITQVACY